MNKPELVWNLAARIDDAQARVRDGTQPVRFDEVIEQLPCTQLFDRMELFKFRRLDVVIRSLIEVDAVIAANRSGEATDELIDSASSAVRETQEKLRKAAALQRGIVAELSLAIAALVDVAAKLSAVESATKAYEATTGEAHDLMGAAGNTLLEWLIRPGE